MADNSGNMADIEILADIEMLPDDFLIFGLYGIGGKEKRQVADPIRRLLREFRFDSEVKDGDREAPDARSVIGRVLEENRFKRDRIDINSAGNDLLAEPELEKLGVLVVLVGESVEFHPTVAEYGCRIRNIVFLRHFTSKAVRHEIGHALGAPDKGTRDGLGNCMIQDCIMQDSPLTERYCPSCRRAILKNKQRWSKLSA